MMFILVPILAVVLVGGLVYFGFQYELTRTMWMSFAQFAEHHDKSIVAIGTAFLAIFTIVLAVATVFLWRATRDLVEDEGYERASTARLRQSGEWNSCSNHCQ
jgi:hypothetical protein